MITQTRLKELVSYNSDTGIFHHIVDRGKLRCGDRAGSIDAEGYRRLTIDKFSYKAHRLAFLYMEGEFPPQQTDHIDQDRLNNKFCNLRKVTPQQNSRNKKRQSTNLSGFTGVGWRNDNKIWRARIYHNGKNINLGEFDALSDAVLARLNAEAEYGYHANHGAV
jgi:hypothetical protein